MTPAALRACGCERCEDALRFHAMLNKLAESMSKTDAELARLSDTVGRMERSVALRWRDDDG